MVTLFTETGRKTLKFKITLLAIINLVGLRMAYLGEFCLLPPVATDQILDISTKRQLRWPPLPSSPPTFDWGFPPNVYWISTPTFIPRYIVHTKYGVVLLHCNGFTTPAYSGTPGQGSEFFMRTPLFLPLTVSWEYFSSNTFSRLSSCKQRTSGGFRLLPVLV